MVDLAPLPGYAYSDAFMVNNSGQIVGVSYTQGEAFDPRATMWRATGRSGAGETSSLR